MDVFITIDTEVWPRYPGWPRQPLPITHRCEREIDAYLLGAREDTRFGLPYQLRLLRESGLKATCFVDPLFSFALGDAPLRTTIQAIVAAGQEIGLHLHPEWLTDPRCPELPHFRGPFIRDYPEEEQLTLIQAGSARLTELGAAAPRSFRAGNWGADRSTLRALRRAGISVDSSLNRVFATSFPDLDRRASVPGPVEIEGVWEFPVTCFRDAIASQSRHLAVTACSFDEFRTMLELAYRNQWAAVVIVLHSFEFVRVDRLARGMAGPRRLLAARFERLCDYLSSNADRLRTRHFAEVNLKSVDLATAPAQLVSSRARTLRRYVAQAASRVY